MDGREFGCGGEGWIRTSVRLRGQIYSLLPLTTRPPLQVGAGALWPCALMLSTEKGRPSLRSGAPFQFRPPDGFGMERVTGIEPVYSAWKAAALPLCYTRASCGAPLPLRTARRQWSVG